jgi:restriction system protein
MAIPKYDELFNPVLRALHDLGGSATNQELEDKGIEILQLPEEEAYERKEGKSQTRLNYRTAWAKSYLKKHGLVDNTERGVWALTAEGQKTDLVDPGEVKATVRAEFANKKRNIDTETQDSDEEETPETEDRSWWTV